MIIKSLGIITRDLLKRVAYNVISHKFYFGQGGQLAFNLTHRRYKMSVQTFWEDYCLLEIEGLKGIKNFNIYEEGNKAYLLDSQLEPQQELIECILKIPEDFTLDGIIKGSIQHLKSEVGQGVRSKPFRIIALGKDQSIILGDIKSQDVKIENKQGKVSFQSLTVQKGYILSNGFSCRKLMTSGELKIDSNRIEARSIIMFGQSSGIFKGKNIKLDSISGKFQIEGDSVKIDHIYGGNNTILIKTKQIDERLVIQTGTGSIKFQSESLAKQNLQKIRLGRMHKGALTVQGQTIIIS